MNKLFKLLITDCLCTFALTGCTSTPISPVKSSVSPLPVLSSLPNPGTVFHYEDTTFKVFDQPLPSDGNIIIDTVFMDRKGFLVIMGDRDYFPGEVIGISNLLEINKEFKSMKVKIDPSKVRNRVHVTIAFDNGDNTFNFEKEEILRDSGNIIISEIISILPI